MGTLPVTGGARGIPWALVAVWVTWVVTIPFLVLGALVALAGVSGSPSAGVPLLPHPTELAVAMAFAAPVWLVGAVATGLAPGLARRTRLLLGACGPVAVAAVLLGLAGASGVGAVLDAVIMLAVAAVTVSIGRQVLAESRGPDHP